MLLDDLPRAIDILTHRQGFPNLSDSQVKTFEFMVKGLNSINQLPTGSGKSYAPLCFPQILEILRDEFNHVHLSSTNQRTLYVIPLVNLFESLEYEMMKLNIPFQFLNTDSVTIDEKAKVIVLTPEKLLNPRVMANIMKLEWSLVSFDEPHLVIQWGTSSKKNRKPFRRAMTELNKLNNLGSVFECHSATINSFPQIYSFFGRQNSDWKTQIEVPDRPDLVYFLLSGSEAPDNVLQLSVVREALLNNDRGMLFIYVQSIEEGNQIFFQILEFCEKHNLIDYSKSKSQKPFAYLHAKLENYIKQNILERARKGDLKVLIATSSGGCGVNLPISTFVGVGLDPETSGFIQASGRTARKPWYSQGSVIWIHVNKVHGRRIPTDSKVRELLHSQECLRKVQNSWYLHNRKVVPEETHISDAHLCCSTCMKKCVLEVYCQLCSEKLSIHSKDMEISNVKETTSKICQFLQEWNFRSTIGVTYGDLNEEIISKQIIEIFNKNRDSSKVKEFLEIFKLSSIQINEIIKYLESLRADGQNSQQKGEITDSSESEFSSDSSHSEEEYFDLSD